MKRYFEVYGVESGFIKQCDSVVDAYHLVKDLKEFDKHNGIKDKYYIQLVCEYPDREVHFDIRVRKYGAFIKFYYV